MIISEKKEEEQELWDYDQSHKIKCNHDFGKLDRPLWKMPFKTEIIVHPWGDTFVQFLTCKKCGLKVNKLFSNKHAEYIVNLDHPKL